MNQLLRTIDPQVTTLSPRIIFSYGMTKSGSTLAFETARSALELSGYEQPRLSIQALGTDQRINFVRHLTAKMVARVWDEVKEIGHPIVLKTHTRPDPAVIDLIDQDHASVIATYRDPREIALSMLDHGVRSRAQGVQSFSEFTDLNSTITNIKSQLDTLTQWLYRPNCLAVFYHDLAFRRTYSTRWIMAHLGLTGPVGPVIDYVDQHRFTQLNLAKPKRFRSEMSHAESRRFRREFSRLFDNLITCRAHLMGRTGPTLPENVLLV